MSMTMKFCTLMSNDTGFNSYQKEWVPTFISPEKNIYCPDLSHTIGETFQLIFFFLNYNASIFSKFQVQAIW